ncbi:MAG: tetratricopeptide repeat protein [Planctomycetota bacterium]|jgi:Tfp pilus assembly protein PilF
MASEDLIQRAEEHARNGEPAEASALFSKALDSDPTCAPALKWLGRTALLAGEIPDARRLLDWLVEVCPDDAEGLALSAVVRLAAGEVDAAHERAVLARTRGESCAAAYAVEAHALRELRRFEESEAAARRAVECAPHDGESRYQLALALAARGEMSACFGELISALETDPRHLRSYVLLGLICEKTGRQKVARRLYEEGLEHLPDNALLRSRLAAS